MRIQKYYQDVVVMVLVMMVLSLSAVPAGAQGSTPSDDQVNEIARELYCPVCENIPLDTCGMEVCEQWRGVIRDKLSEGWTKEEIKAYFVSQYGDRVLGEPPRRGFNWLVYVVPPVVFVVGVYLLYKGFRSWKSQDDDRLLEAERAADQGNADEEYLSRVEEELRGRE
ncbi:MAG: cytochrome c-type biogenesis protein CcmH [Anaerolineales bacterium]|nr:cytochrome c-type biogenesis protein CcmH [Anaerolineales bacterium]